MRAKAIQFLIAALLASVASGQPPAEVNLDRVFHFTHTETAQDLQEIATVIRAITDIRQASLDTAQKALALRGTASQIALAEWLFFELDWDPQALAQQSQNSARHEYRLSGDDVVRVFYLTHTATVQDLQEVATLVRAMTEVRRLFTYNAPRAVVLRGTASQIALAEWLFFELDKPADRQALAQRSQDSATHEYRLSGDDVVRVFYLTHIATVQDLQRVATQVRAMTEVRRLFTYNAPRAVVLRGTASQIALADRLIKEQDR
ncbi:MAG: hypothetical protein HY235_15380 [Acidobacteria bacterium]|nr:hypothetical protein [Acidobacteriota bacterium]